MPSRAITSQIITDHGGGVVYEPWTDGYAVGFRATSQSRGLRRYILLNPSQSDGQPGDSEPDVFVYQGPAGDTAEDSPVCVVLTLDDTPNGGHHPDTIALNRIAALLDGTEHNADMLTAVTEIVRSTGRKVRDLPGVHVTEIRAPEQEGVVRYQPVVQEPAGTRECSRCGDTVQYLSSRDLCDGCEAGPVVACTCCDTRSLASRPEGSRPSDECPNCGHQWMCHGGR